MHRQKKYLAAALIMSLLVSTHQALAVDPMFTGVDGALNINGTTVTISPSTKLYSSVSITNGGILNIVGNGSWMIIGSAGNFIIDATSKIQYRGVGTTTSDDTGSSTTAPDGTVLSYTSTWGDGGVGGGSSCGQSDIEAEPGNPLSVADGKCGGPTLHGNGGGGAAFDYADGGTPTLVKAGDGSSGSLGGSGPTPACAGGAGGTLASKDGVDGDDCQFSAPYYTNGAGGGGGYRGDNGGAIYIKVGGTITMAGTIDVDGSQGGNGGQGGDADDAPGAWGGGGGGGGAGGNGGVIKIRYAAGTTAGTFSHDQGGGGAGGFGGIASTSLTPVDGDPGEAANSDGNNGSVEITALSLPTVATLTPSSLGQTSVTLNGSITDIGGTSVTVRGFVYGLTTSYGATSTESGTFSTGAFLSALSSLTCGSTYHWKGYATNAVGTGYTSDSTFSTSACTVVPPASTGSISGSRPRSSKGTIQPVVTNPPVFFKPVFTQSFGIGNLHDDIKNLQKYLNSKGYTVAVSGPGSPNNESNYFGNRTRDALARFQSDNKIYPSVGFFGPLTRKFIESNP